VRVPALRTVARAIRTVSRRIRAESVVAGGPLREVPHRPEEPAGGCL